MKKVSEKTIERRLKRDIEKRGGICLKLWGMSFAGFPDRLILMPGARVWFRELKTFGKTPSKLQQSRIKWLVRLGFNASAILNEDDYLQLINEIDLL